MPRDFTVISGEGHEQHQYKVLMLDERVRHFRNILGTVHRSAQNVWGEIWAEMQGSVTDDCLILPKAEKGFNPACGWPEFLEKLWLLKHYIDYAQSLSEKGI